MPHLGFVPGSARKSPEGRQSARCNPYGLWAATLVALLALLQTSQVQAQAARSTSLNALALEWAKGRFASPLMCEFDGKSMRGIRRILITSGVQSFHPAANKIQFVDIDADDASRCTTDLGEEQPTIVGVLHFRLVGHHNPSDLAPKDFQNALKRDRGFEFEVVSGLLQLRSVGADKSSARKVNFKGGRVALQRLRKGSEASLLLRDYVSRRKLLLELEAKDGTRLSFPLFVPETP